MSALREALKRAGLATQEQAAKADEEAKKRAEKHEHQQREAREAEEAALTTLNKRDRDFVPPPEWTSERGDE